MEYQKVRKEGKYKDLPLMHDVDCLIVSGYVEEERDKNMDKSSLSTLYVLYKFKKNKGRSERKSGIWWYDQNSNVYKRMIQE